jgi:hypothetical protein
MVAGWREPHANYETPSGHLLPPVIEDQGISARNRGTIIAMK